MTLPAAAGLHSSAPIVTANAAHQRERSRLDSFAAPPYGAQRRAIGLGLFIASRHRVVWAHFLPFKLNIGTDMLLGNGVVAALLDTTAAIGCFTIVRIHPSALVRACVRACVRARILCERVFGRRAHMRTCLERVRACMYTHTFA